MSAGHRKPNSDWGSLPQSTAFIVRSQAWKWEISLRFTPTWSLSSGFLKGKNKGAEINHLNCLQARGL